MKISFIIPAHNEEAFVGRCIVAVQTAMKAVRNEFEIIVVDDASSDTTAFVAEAQQARVIRVAHNQISATRNAGARAAIGDLLFFVDADTLVGERTVQSALELLHDGAIGGGCVPRYDGTLPLWFKAVNPVFILVVRILRQPGGSCLFCTKQAFDSTGGFSEAHFAAEDAVFVSALKRTGRFAVIREPVVTSGRNFRAHSFWTYLRLVLRLLFRGSDGFRNRRGLDMWYRPSRPRDRA